MPFIRITLGRAASPAQQQAIARQATALIADLLHKRAEVTAVQVDCTPASTWCIAGEAVATALTPAHGDIYITAGTNTAAEKAALIAALHRLLGETLGAVPEACYIVIHEIAASDWGYAGLPQAARRQAAELL